VKELPLEEFAASLGLPGAPHIKFIKGEDSKLQKNKSRALMDISGNDDSDEQGEGNATKRKSEVRTRYDRMFERQNQDVLADHYSKLINDEGTAAIPGRANDTSEDEDFLSVKRRFEAGDKDLTDIQHGMGVGILKKDVKMVQIDGREPLVIDSKRREKLLNSKKKLLKYKSKGTRLVYDEEGNSHEVYEMEDEETFKAKGDANDQRTKYLEAEAEKTKFADIADKAIAKQKRREKKNKKKARERESASQQDGPTAILAPYHEGHQCTEPDAPRREEEDDEAGPVKKQKKWFEVSLADKANEGRSDSRKSKSFQHTQPPTAGEPVVVRTLEDLETLATGLLG
jgi:ATP-dependent RNA helicase DDX10/DBP4